MKAETTNKKIEAKIPYLSNKIIDTHGSTEATVNDDIKL